MASWIMKLGEQVSIWTAEAAAIGTAIHVRGYDGVVRLGDGAIFLASVMPPH